MMLNIHELRRQPRGFHSDDGTSAQISFDDKYLVTRYIVILIVIEFIVTIKPKGIHVTRDSSA